MDHSRFPADAVPDLARSISPKENSAAPMKILVTGGSGFIGGACAAVLRARGTDLLTPSSREFNLLDEAAVLEFLKREQPTHLLHAAWRPVRGDVMMSPDNAAWKDASLFLLQAFHEAGGQRAAILGSSAEYDWNDGVCQTGITPLKPATAYGLAKHALYMSAGDYAKKAGLSFVWPRVFFVYGPGEHESRLITYVLKSLLEGHPAEMTHGQQVRDYLYIRDAAEGVVAALVSAHEGEIDIASGQPHSLRHIATEIARQLEREDLLRLGVRPMPPYETPAVVSDPTHARANLNWTPQVPLSVGIAEMVAWGRKAFVRVAAALGSLEGVIRVTADALAPIGPMTVGF